MPEATTWPSGSHVARVRPDRGAGYGVDRAAASSCLLGDLLLGLDLGLVALLLAGGLVGVLDGPVALALGELLLEFARVQQDQRGQLDRAASGVDGTAEAFGHDVRDEAAMVEMGVGQDDRVQRRRVVGEGNAVAHDLVRTALEHAAVDRAPWPAR